MTLLLALSGLAHAGHWWGIGPTLGTTGFPIEYPVVFPGIATGANGAPRVEPVTFDLRAGAHGVYYVGTGGRVGARLQLGGNFATWGFQEATVEYEWILTRADNIQVLGGGGLGFGHENFGADPEAADPDAYLDVTYFPVRAQIGILWRDRTRAYEADLFGTWHLAGEQVFSATGNADDEVTGTAVSLDDTTQSDAALYVALGAEITVYFGDFKNRGGDDKNDNAGKGKKKKNGD